MIEPFFRADLHTHSTASDGSDTPQELVEKAHLAGLQALSLTDHDTVDGIEQAFIKAKALGVQFLSGIELSSLYQEGSVHILGYGIDPAHEGLQTFLKKQIEARAERNRRIVEKLGHFGMVIDLEALESNPGVIGRVHLAKELIRLGFVSDIKEAFHKWLGDRAPCFESGVRPVPSECIIQIHQAGGKAFIAHPHLMHRKQVIKLLKNFAWDGLEVYYGRYLLDTQLEWLELANRYRLLASGGSDYHGSVKSESFLASSWVDERCLKAIVKDTFWEKYI